MNDMALPLAGILQQAGAAIPDVDHVAADQRQRIVPAASITDGRLKPAEIKKLDYMLDRNSVMIFNKKHNAVQRVY